MLMPETSYQFSSDAYGVVWGAQGIGGRLGRPPSVIRAGTRTGPPKPRRSARGAELQRGAQLQMVKFPEIR
jgi:hypothetical protein